MPATQVRSCRWFPGGCPEPGAQPGTLGRGRRAVRPVDSPRLGTRHLLPRRRGRAGAPTDAPAAPRALADPPSNDSEVTPGAAATSRCGRQDGNAHGKLRGRAGRGAGTAAQGGARARRPPRPLSCAPGACRLEELGEERGEHCSVGPTTKGRAGAGNGVWVEMGGIAGALGGGQLLGPSQGPAGDGGEGGTFGSPAHNGPRVGASAGAARPRPRAS